MLLKNCPVLLGNGAPFRKESHLQTQVAYFILFEINIEFGVIKHGVAEKISRGDIQNA